MRRREALQSTRRAGGWSFLDIMAVLTIVALLLALAVPAYRQYAQRAHRAEAVQALLRIAACQERIRGATGAYDPSRCLRQPPGDRYRVRLFPEGAVSSPMFEAVAEPVEGGARDDCGRLGIDQAGTRSIGGDDSRLAACWSGR